MRKISKTNIITSYIVLICFFASLITAIPVNASAADENEPKKCIECNKEAIEISSYEDLNKIRGNLSGCFILTDDIDCEGKEFTPIEGSFTGHFDGNNHKVLNLKINGSEKVGFFSSISSGTVENFAIEDAKIKATGSDVGILVGVAENAKISNCYVKGEIEGLSRIGGISGSGISKTTYTNCYSYLSKITSKSNEYDVAGISGGNDSTIKAINCYTISDGQKSPICGSIDYNNDKLTEENFEYCYYNEEFEKNKFTEFADFGIKDSQMTNKDTYKSWDFDNVWQIDNTKNSGYPYLKSFLEKGNSLEITPGNVVVAKGHEQNFNLQLKINGKVVLPTETKWSIEGNTSTDTNIDKNGEFTLGLNETGDVVTVKAVATFKSSSGKESVVKGYSNVFISNIKDADTPKFGLNSSQEVSYKIGDNNPEPLKANASVNDGGTLSYQWYINNVNSNENGQPINNAIGDTYIPDLDVAGTYYYYVIVTNNNESSEITGAHMIQKASSVYTVKVAANHEIIYDTNGGTLSDSAVKSFNELDSDIALENPTRDGYDFDGWYTDKNFVSDKVTSIKKGTSEDVYLFAKWVQKGQTPEKDEGAHKDFINISFDINGAIGNTPENITVKNGESIKLPVILNAVKPGFIFNGWTYEDGKLADNIIKCEGKDIKLVASWKKVTADVSIDEINSEYSNVSEVVGKINVKSSETVSVKVNVMKDGKDYTNFVYNKDSNTITIKTEGFGIRDNYKVTAEVYYEGNKLDSNTVSFAVNYIKDIETRYEGKVTDTININNDKTVQEALSLNANGEEFYKAISNLSLSRAITINDGTSNGEYIVSTSDSSVAVVSEKPLSGVNIGDKEITTKENKIYINGLKDGNCTITITHKQSGVTRNINVNINSLSKRLYVVKPEYTSGYRSYIKLNDSLSKRIIRYSNYLNDYGEDDSSDITKLKWTFKSDNGVDGVKLIKLSNGDVVLYNSSKKFTGTLYSNITNFDILISRSIDNMKTGEEVRGGSYPRNTLGINGTYKINLKLVQNSNDYVQSNIDINAYLLKNEKIVDHVSKNYYGNLSDKPDISLGFNSDNIGEISSNDTLELVYEIASNKHKPRYGRNIIISQDELKDTKIIEQLSRTENNKSSIAIFKEINKGIESEETKKYISLTDDQKEQDIRIYTATSEVANQASAEVSIGSRKYDNSKRNNVTFDGMKYTWYVNNIKLNEKSVESGTTNNIKLKLINNKGNLTQLISSDFKVSSSINIPDPTTQQIFSFFGGISGGEIVTKPTGKFNLSFQLPKSIEANFEVSSTDNTLSRTFVALLGYSGEKDLGKGGNKKDDDKKKEKFKETLNKEMQKIKDKKAGKKGGKLDGSLSGYMMGTLNYLNGKWSYSVSGGGINGSIGVSYGITNNVFLGPVPVYFGFKVGLQLDGDILVAGQNSYHDLFDINNYNLVLDGMIGVTGKVCVEGGIGFDAKVLAVKFGAVGEIKLSYNHRGVMFFNNGSLSRVFNGGETTLSGSLKLVFQAKFLFFKTKIELASGSLSKTWSNGYKFPSGRPNDFLKNGSDDLEIKGSSIVPLSFAKGNGIDSDDWKSNIYPYADPISSKDGKSIGLLYNDGDMNDPKSIKPAISYSTDGNYSEPEVITGWDEDKNVVSSMDYDGDNNMQVLAFSTAKYAGIDDDNIQSIEDAMNSSDIYVTTVIDGKKITKKLTDDMLSDSAPIVYTNGNKAVVLWQKGNYNIDTDSNGNYTDGGYTDGDTLWYSTFDGNEWTDPKMIEDGSIGSTQAYDVAIMEDGTIMAITSRSNDYSDDLNSRQIVSYIIKDGQVLREQLTDDNLPETQPRVTLYNNDGKEAFAVGYIKGEDSLGAKSGEDGETPNVSHRLILKGYDKDGNAISNLDCQSDLDEVTEKYDFVKSESKDLGVSWIGYDYDGKCNAYSKIVNISENDSSLSKTYTIDTLESGTAINKLSSYIKNDNNGNPVVSADILAQKITEENTDEEKPAFITNNSITITDNIEDVTLSVTDEFAYPNETINCNISFKNSCSDKIKALMVEADNQVQTISTDVDINDYGSVNYTYTIGNEVRDVDVKITPILNDNSTGKTITKKMKLYLPNLYVIEPEIIKKQSGGVYTLSSYIGNIGVRQLEDEDYVIVKIVENNDKVSKVEANSEGATVLDDGTIKISGKEAIKALNEDFYNLTFNHKVEKDSYNKNGVKPMHIYVEAYNKDDEKYDDIMLTYSEASFDFVKPSLTEGEQFRYDIEQNNDLQYTSAKITITNNYEESGEGNFKISLLDNDSNVIESKIVKMSFDSQEAKEFNVEFDKVGKEIVISETQEEPTEPVTPKPVEPEPIVNPGYNNNSGIYNINSTNSRRNNLDNNSNSKSTSKETGNSIPVGLLLFNITSISVIAIFGLKKLRTKNNKGIK